MDLSHNSILFISASVFVGGLIGSPHCLSMCGPIVFNFSTFPARLVAYQFGRMLTYTAAGFLAGKFGHTVLGTQSPVWLSSIALVVISALLFVNGYRAITGRALHFALPRFASILSSKLWKRISSPRFPRIAGAGLAGAFTVFLPCGHLYGFLVGAVATGSGLGGALFMFAFWLGSTPLLSFGARWFHRFLNARSVNGQRLAGVLLVIAGLFSLSSFALRLEAAPNGNHAHGQQEAPVQAPRCH